MTENPEFVQSVGIRLKRLLRFPRHAHKIASEPEKGWPTFNTASAFWLWTFAFGRSVCFRIRPETLNYEGFREQAPNAEHPIKKKSAGEGNRTPVCSLGSCRSTIELHPRSERSEW